MRHSAFTSVSLVTAAWICCCAAANCSSQEIFFRGWATVPAVDNGLISESIEPFSFPEQNPGGTGELTDSKSHGTDSNTGQMARGRTFQLRGRLDIDAIGTTQSPANVATFGDFGNVVGVRRAWIGAQGDLAIGGRYIAEIDLASGSVIVRDMFVGLGDVQDRNEFRAGRFLEPFSLEIGTPTYVFPFLEPSAVSLLDPLRNWGLGHFQSDLSETTMFALGVFQAGTDPNDFQIGDGSTVGLTGKLTAAPINEGDGERLVHLGLAFSERLPERGVIIIGLQPQTTLLGVGDSPSSPFAPRIPIPASFQQLLNLQCAVANGPFWTQAEWYGTWINQRGGGPVFFHGCHADCGYFLTGEHRQYQGTSGVFGPVKVNRPLICCHATRDRPAGWGAWELTARFTYLDFQDSDTPQRSKWPVGRPALVGAHIRSELVSGGSPAADVQLFLRCARRAEFWDQLCQCVCHSVRTVLVIVGRGVVVAVQK